MSRASGGITAPVVRVGVRVRVRVRALGLGQESNRVRLEPG